MRPRSALVFFVSIVLLGDYDRRSALVGRLSPDEQFAQSAATFNAAKKLGVVALTLSLLMWLSAFLSVGNEWFLMWQSKEWSGEQGADHMFAIAGIILLYLVMPMWKARRREETAGPSTDGP